MYKFLVLLLTLTSCSENNEMKKTNQKDESTEKKAIKNDSVSSLFKHDTVIYLTYLDTNKIEVRIRIPEVELQGTIMALPGWNYPNTHWCDSTTLCEKALKYGYAIILPQMGKSNYCSQTYKETRKDWLHYPTRTWVVQTLIPTMQKNGLLIEGDPNFIMGLSTGARGALLIGLDLNKIWRGLALLSGDFDHSKFPNDRLYIGSYGKMSEFPERWKTHDNSIYLISQLKSPVYIGHGKLDRVVDVKHSQLLADTLRKKNWEFVYHVDSKGAHNYNYWNSEVDAILEFFENHQ